MVTKQSSTEGQSEYLYLKTRKISKSRDSSFRSIISQKKKKKKKLKHIQMPNTATDMFSQEQKALTYSFF